MIPLTTSLCQSLEAESDEFANNSRWQQELAQAIKDPIELLNAVQLSADEIPSGIELNQPFPQRVPHSYVKQMQPGDPNDPLLLQVLPRQLESITHPDYLQDPVGDTTATVIPGLLHKYHGRVLLITTGACPIHCRYCFRRHFPYADNRPDGRQWQAAIDYISDNPEINEVILSGGDPLSLSTQRLTALTAALHDIPHLKRLRIHSRMPIVLPSRIDGEFLDWLTHLPWQAVLVTHCNHPNELSAGVQNALQKIRNTGCTLLNQSVLLKAINDDIDTLCKLSETLFASGVLPYYLHLLDRVQGAAHFDVKTPVAQCLVNGVRRRLPGFLVPQLVRETAGSPYKEPTDLPASEISEIT